MPKLIDRVRSAAGALAPPISPAEIERRIVAAEATLAQLTAEHQRAALDAEADVPGAADRLKSQADRLAQAGNRLTTLRSALVAAQEAEERGRRQLQAKLRKDNIARINAALAQRDVAAERLADALEIACGAWRDLLDYSEKAAVPVPGVAHPLGVMITTGELRRAIERELFRVGARPVEHAWDFPGAKPHDLNYRDQPQNLPRLVDVVKAASAHLNAILRGDASEPPE